MDDIRGISKRIYILVSIHAVRLQIDPDIAYMNALRFAHIIGIFENNGKLHGNNIPQSGKGQSSAKGLYQYLTDSVTTAKNRLSKYIKFIFSDDPNEMSWEEQTLLLLGDLLEKRGSDRYMKVILSNPTLSVLDTIEEAYYVLHHTAPDTATKNMVRRKLK